MVSGGSPSPYNPGGAGRVCPVLNRCAPRYARFNTVPNMPVLNSLRVTIERSIDKGERMTQGTAPGASHEKTRVPEESVRQELSRVLASHEFHSSKRSQDFIRYVVEHTLGGRTDLLKERTI